MMMMSIMAIPRGRRGTTVCDVVALSLIMSLFLVNIVAPLCSADDSILYSGESLTTGQSLNLKSYTLVMQADCNLVLYDIASPVWSSKTAGLGQKCYATMEKVGKLVIYDSNNKPVWQSNSDHSSGSYALILQKDRNLVIYVGVWATYSQVGGAHHVSGTHGIVMKSSSTNATSTFVNSLPAANATLNESNDDDDAGIAMVVNK